MIIGQCNIEEALNRPSKRFIKNNCQPMNRNYAVLTEARIVDNCSSILTMSASLGLASSRCLTQDRRESLEELPVAHTARMVPSSCIMGFTTNNVPSRSRTWVFTG